MFEPYAQRRPQTFSDNPSPSLDLAPPTGFSAPNPRPSMPYITIARLGIQVLSRLARGWRVLVIGERGEGAGVSSSKN